MPIPKEKTDKEKMIKSIKSLIDDAKGLKESYREKLVKIQDEFLDIISWFSIKKVKEN